MVIQSGQSAVQDTASAKMREPKRLTLRGLAWTSGLILAATSLGVSLVGYTATLHLIDREIRIRLEDTAQEIIGDQKPPKRSAVIRRLLAEENGPGTNDTGFMLIDEHGRKIAGLLQMPVPPIGFSSIDYTQKVEGLHRGRALAKPVGDGSVLVLVADADVVDDFEWLMFAVYGVGFVLSVAVFVAGIGRMISIIHRRMDEIRVTALEIADGNLAQRLTVRGYNDEFALQAAAFNAMLDRIAELVDHLKTVSDDIAHDLRTPLMKLRNRVVALEKYSGDRDARRAVRAALDQCDQVLALFAAILRLSEIQGHRRREQFQPVRLDDILQMVRETYELPMAEQGRELRVVGTSAATVLGDRGLLTQMMTNLLENAIHHTPPGTSVLLSIERHGDAVVFKVRDNGPGIAAADRALALRRFGRVAPGKHRGFGLGLPLVAAIARLHHGSLELTAGNPGLVATVMLPRLTDFAPAKITDKTT